MSVETDRGDLPAARHRRLVALGALRAPATAVVLAALHHLLPDQRAVGVGRWFARLVVLVAVAFGSGR